MTDEDMKTYAPTLVLKRHTGLLVAWQQQDLHFRGSPEQLNAQIHKVTLKNMLFGWWSPMSLIINPVISLVNYGNFYQYKNR